MLAQRLLLEIPWMSVQAEKWEQIGGYSLMLDGDTLEITSEEEVRSDETLSRLLGLSETTGVPLKQDSALFISQRILPVTLKPRRWAQPSSQTYRMVIPFAQLQWILGHEERRVAVCTVEGNLQIWSMKRALRALDLPFDDFLAMILEEDG